jgi:asparagine synthase (glutamine-hydrolysing)
VLPPILAHAYWQNRMLLKEDRDSLFTDDFSRAGSKCDPFALFLSLADKTSFKDPLDLCMYLDQKNLLPEGILAKVDRMSMAHGLEVRCPLLDLEFVRLAYQIPASLKMKGGAQKYLLKKLLGTMIPETLFSKKKKGFSIPANQWLREDLRSLMCDALFSQSFTSMNIIKPRILETIVHEHINKKSNHSHLLWTLMVFSIWSNQLKLNV